MVSINYPFFHCSGRRILEKWTVQSYFLLLCSSLFLLLSLSVPAIFKPAHSPHYRHPSLSPFIPLLALPLSVSQLPSHLPCPHTSRKSRSRVDLRKTNDSPGLLFASMIRELPWPTVCSHSRFAYVIPNFLSLFGSIFVFTFTFTFASITYPPFYQPVLETHEHIHIHT